MTERVCYLVPKEAATTLEVYLLRCRERGVSRDEALDRVIIAEGVKAARLADDLDDMAKWSTEEMEKLLASSCDLDIDLPPVEYIEWPEYESPDFGEFL